MISLSTSDLLFDDLAILQQHISRSQLIASSVNSNCDCVGVPSLNAYGDCASSPILLIHDDRHTDQVSQSAIAAY